MAPVKKKILKKGVKKVVRPTPKAKVKKAVTQTVKASLPRSNAKSTQTRIPKVVNLLSPSVPTLVPTMAFTGTAFPYTGMRRFDITQAIGTTILFAVTNTGRSGTLASIVTLLGTAGATPTYTVETVSAVAASDISGAGPSGGRAMKASIGLVNTSPSHTRGGRVTFYNSPARTRLDTTPGATGLGAAGTATFNYLCAKIREMPTSKAYDGAYFSVERQTTCSVTDMITYEDFGQWVGTETVDSFWSHIAVWPDSVHRERPMTTSFVLLSPPDTPQSYTVTLAGSWYTRWPFGSIPGQTMTKIPNAGPGFLATVHEVGAAAAEAVTTLEGAGDLAKTLIAEGARHLVPGLAGGA